MPTSLANYRVFIASPSGLDDERAAFRELLNEYNISEANPRGLQFQPVGWELTLQGHGRPQNLINELVGQCDYFVLLLHDRWGSSPFPSADKDPEYTSGTEEEFHVALDCLNNVDKPMSEIVLVFKAVEERQMADPGPQLREVLNFRRERESNKDFLYSVIDSVASFQDVIRRHLGDWSRRHENGSPSERDILDPGPTQQQFNARFYLAEGKAFGVSSVDREEEALSDAERLAESGRTVEAELAFSKLVVNNPSPIALARYGRFLRKSGQLERATAVLDQATRAADLASDLGAKAYAVRQNARILERLGKHTDAGMEYMRAIVLFETVGDKEGQARTLRDISSVNRAAGDLEGALKNLDKAMSLYHELGSNDGIASVWGYKGLVHSAHGDFKSALESHQAALNLHGDGTNLRAVAIIKGNLGVVFRALGQLEDSLDMHESALDYFRSAGEAGGMVRELTNCGVTQRKLGRLADAARAHDEALTIARKDGDTRNVSIQYANLGSVKKDQGDYKEAEVYYQRSIELAERFGDLKSVSIQNENLGALYRITGRSVESEERLRSALEGYEKLKMNYGIANTRRELGLLLCETGRVTQGLPFLEESRALFLRSGLHLRVRELDVILKTYGS